MLNRRHAMFGCAAAVAPTLSLNLSGCDMNAKKNIKGFGKTFDYLNDPELRQKETGDSKLVIKEAEFSGASFKDLTWRNIKFENCDFAGAYQISPDRLENSQFENCRFVGIHGFGDMVSVRFVQCTVADGGFLQGQPGSKNLVFENCKFLGTNEDRNHWGAVGGYGESQFIECQFTRFKVTAHTASSLVRCEGTNMRILADSREADGRYAVLNIEGCKFNEALDMRVATLQSLTLRDTTVEGTLDLSDAQIKGDVLIERVKGGVVRGYVKRAVSFTVKDSQILGDGTNVFDAFAGGIQRIYIEGATFGTGTKSAGGSGTDGVTIAGGTGMDLSKPRERVTESFIVKNSKIPQLNAHHLNSTLVRIEASELGEANLSSSLIDTLELEDVRINQSLDLSQTQAKHFKLGGSTDLKKLGRNLKLDGSDLKRAK